MARYFWGCLNIDSTCDSCSRKYLCWDWKTLKIKNYCERLYSYSHMHYIPTAIVLMNSRPRFSRNTVCRLPDWSPSILITSSFVFGEQKVANVSKRSLLESIMGPVTSLIGRRKYLRKFYSWKFKCKITTILLLVGVGDVFASTCCQYIQLWLVLPFFTRTHLHIVEQTIPFLPGKRFFLFNCKHNSNNNDLLQECHIDWTSIGSSNTRITQNFLSLFKRWRTQQSSGYEMTCCKGRQYQSSCYSQMFS